MDLTKVGVRYGHGKSGVRYDILNTRMHRRDFLKQGIAAVTTAAIASVDSPAGAGIVNAMTRPRHSGAPFYVSNRVPLRPSPFLRLPPGSVKAHGWLRHQLDLQLDGLNGRMTEISDYLDYDNCGWVDSTKDAWEELPYWLRGFGDLGYVTGDPRVLALSRKWIDGILATQQSDGWFGPERLRANLDNGPDLWPHMLVLTVLESHFDYSGDDRVLPFMSRFFRLLAKQPDDRFGKGWASTRWGDAIETMLWLYNRTGDAWLLDLATKVHRAMADWTGGIPTWHNVNIAQGFREPAQYWLVSGDPSHLAATSAAYDTVMRGYGQFAGGGFAGDENCRTGHHDPRQGFETCGYVEFMRSFEILTRTTGEPIWADRCEDIAFNSLPAAFDPEQKGLHYITSANCADIDNAAKTHGQFDNNWAMQAYMPGVHNYRCCPHNYGMGWPYYVEEMWLATLDGGLCASMYGASEVTANVGDGSSIRVVQSTDYPFGEEIHMTISAAKPIAFPLSLRIPRWCRDASIRVNGVPMEIDAAAGSYARIERVWHESDQIALHLPMEIALRRWDDNGGSVSVDHGPLTYSLKIDEQWKRIGGTDRWPEYAVTAGSPWNFGLILDRTRPAHSFTVERKSGSIASNPFTLGNAPVEIHAGGCLLTDWRTDVENVIDAVPQSPVASDQLEQPLTLIPMAAARLRITSFPVVERDSTSPTPSSRGESKTIGLIQG